MSRITVDATARSLNKYSEYLCGDTVELLKTEDSDVIILADGMGSGVKANILSTLTAKILGTMFLNGADLEECVETIVQTLPIDAVRGVAYATFSILQIFHSGEVYLVEYDNPRCVFLRQGKPEPIESRRRFVKDKELLESRFTVEKGDALILMSDGVTHAGVGTSREFAFGWPWEKISEYAAGIFQPGQSSLRLVTGMLEECSRIYDGRPGDDTTVAAARIIDRKAVNLLTGPPVNRDDDERITEDFMEDDQAVKIISGGTSATIISRELGRPLRVSMDYPDPDIPPVAYMDGIDLVTEGVLTLRRVVQLLQQFAEEQKMDSEFLAELDKNNGASLMARILIEDCTELHLFVGRAQNSAYRSPELAFELGVRQALVQKLSEEVKKTGKTVDIKYY